MSQAVSYIPDLGFSPNQFTLLNSAPNAQTFRWGGIQFTLPPSDVVGSKPAIDADKDPIPGSYILSDCWAPDKEGVIPDRSSPPNWLAFEAIRNVLGVDSITKVARGVPAKSGISFLPNYPTKEVVAAIREDGRRRWVDSQVEWAQYEVSAYEARVAASRAAGVAAAPPDRDYARAISILKKAKEDAGGVLPEAPTDEDLEMEAQVKAMALELATKAAEGKDIDRNKLAEELMQDPKVRAALGRKYQIRKRGYLDVPEVPTPEG